MHCRRKQALVDEQSYSLHAGMGRANLSLAVRSWRTRLMGTAWWPASHSAAAARSCARDLCAQRSARALLSAFAGRVTASNHSSL